MQKGERHRNKVPQGYVLFVPTFLNGQTPSLNNGNDRHYSVPVPYHGQTTWIALFAARVSLFSRNRVTNIISLKGDILCKRVTRFKVHNISDRLSRSSDCGRLSTCRYPLTFNNLNKSTALFAHFHSVHTYGVYIVGLVEVQYLLSESLPAWVTSYSTAFVTDHMANNCVTVMPRWSWCAVMFAILQPHDPFFPCLAFHRSYLHNGGYTLKDAMTILLHTDIGRRWFVGWLSLRM